MVWKGPGSAEVAVRKKDAFFEGVFFVSAVGAISVRAEGQATHERKFKRAWTGAETGKPCRYLMGLLFMRQVGH